MQRETIEAIGSDKTRLCVQFTWRGDRYGHTICLGQADGELVPILESSEGSPHENWPPSPALQSLSVHELPDGRRALLLVGMAGGSHWSACIEPMAGHAGLTFDIACRHKAAPGWLGSRYQIRAPLNGVSLEGDDGRVTKDEATLVVEPRVSPLVVSTTRWRFTLRPQ
jgi:hypothetical protein